MRDIAKTTIIGLTVLLAAVAIGTALMSRLFESTDETARRRREARTCSSVTVASVGECDEISGLCRATLGSGEELLIARGIGRDLECCNDGVAKWCHEREPGDAAGLSSPQPAPRPEAPAVEGGTTQEGASGFDTPPVGLPTPLPGPAPGR